MDAHNLHLFSIRGAAEVESKWLAADCSGRAILLLSHLARGRTMIGAATRLAVFTPHITLRFKPSTIVTFRAGAYVFFNGEVAPASRSRRHATGCSDERGRSRRRLRDPHFLQNPLPMLCWLRGDAMRHWRPTFFEACVADRSRCHGIRPGSHEARSSDRVPELNPGSIKNLLRTRPAR
jgi:hypothetical protein